MDAEDKSINKIASHNVTLSMQLKMNKENAYQVSIKRWRIVISYGIDPTEYHVVITIRLPGHASSIFPCCRGVEPCTHVRMQRKQGYLGIGIVF